MLLNKGIQIPPAYQEEGIRSIMYKFLFPTMFVIQFYQEVSVKSSPGVSVKTGDQSFPISPQGQQSPGAHTVQNQGALIILNRNRGSGPQGQPADGSIGFQRYRFHRGA